MDIMYILKDLVKCRFDIQKFINNRYRDPTRMVIPTEHIEFVQTDDGIKYHLNRDLLMLPTIYQYDFSGIRKNDVVLDIGANIGMFAIPASRRSDHVIALEPVMTDELYENVALNGANVTIIPGALGDGLPTRIEWGDRVRVVPTFTLEMLKRLCGRIDYLKCDCEGYEWLICPEELEGIREIEMELHCFPELHPNKQLIDYIKEHWDCRIEDHCALFNDSGLLKMLHAKLVVQP